MLQRMGWEEGKGLGLQEEGITEHIKVKVKRDNCGEWIVDATVYMLDNIYMCIVHVPGALLLVFAL